MDAIPIDHKEPPHVACSTMAELFSTAQPEDYYSSPAFSVGNRARRLVWNVVYQIFFRHSPKPLFIWRIFLLRLFGAKVHSTAYIYPKAVIWAPWLLRCGEFATIADGVTVYNPGGVSLDHHAIASQDSYLCGATHDYNSPKFPLISKAIALEPYSWVCARAIVLPGVTLSEGSVLGAGAVTSKSLDSWSVYAGNPAVKVAARTKIANAVV